MWKLKRNVWKKKLTNEAWKYNVNVSNGNINVWKKKCIVAETQTQLFNSNNVNNVYWPLGYWSYSKKKEKCVMAV
jgi:hypothetical protein